MSQDQLIILLFKVSTISIIVSALGFVLLYTKLAPWWKSPIGRTLVWKDILLILALVPSTISFFFSFNRLTSHIAAWFDIGVFFLISAVMLTRSRIWYAIHRDGRSKEEPDEPGT